MTQGDMSNICNTKRLSCRTGLVGQRRMLPSKGTSGGGQVTGSFRMGVPGGHKYAVRVSRNCPRPPLPLFSFVPFVPSTTQSTRSPIRPLFPSPSLHRIASAYRNSDLDLFLCKKGASSLQGFFFGGEQNHRRGGHRSIRRVNPLTLLAIWHISFSGILNSPLSS